VEFDWSVGEIMKTLDRLKLAENTLIVLCSDNGPVLDDGYVDGAVEKLGSHEPAGPFSGGKYSVFEGGTRTPFIARGPDASSRACPMKSSAPSISPRALRRSRDAALPENACLDSLQRPPALLGEKGAKGRDSLLQQDNNGTNLGLRMGDWKLVRMKNKGTPKPWSRRRSAMMPGPTCIAFTICPMIQPRRKT
jgi:arylsulfatase A-like enzyme